MIKKDAKFTGPGRVPLYVLQIYGHDFILELIKHEADRNGISRSYFGKRILEIGIERLQNDPEEMRKFRALFGQSVFGGEVE
jgi:hypothetical protein